MPEQHNNFKRFYRGTTSDFNEQEHLTDISMLRYTLERGLIEAGAIKNTFNSAKPYQKIFNGEGYRIPQNGGIKIRCINGRPADIITCYGEFPVSRLEGDYYNITDEGRQSAYEEKLIEKLGLKLESSRSIPTDIPGQERRIEIMLVNQLPWIEKPLPKAGESYLNHRINLTEDNTFENYRKNISADYGSIENYHQLIREETNNLETALELVNLNLINSNQEKYIIPETYFLHQPFHDGYRRTDYFRRHPEKIQPEMMRLKKSLYGQTQNTNIDLGREM